MPPRSPGPSRSAFAAISAKLLVLLLLFEIPLFTSSCGTPGQGASPAGSRPTNQSPTQPPSSISISISPSSAILPMGGSQQFSAVVKNSSLGVTWTVSLGTISSTGLYTAPADASATDVTVTAASTADPTKTASATITLVAASPTQLLINSGSLPPATTGIPYSAGLTASGGTLPYTWSLSSGALPAGLTLDSPSGTISGTPTASGTFTFTAKVMDAASQSASEAMNLPVSTASAFDGPAELPRIYLQTAMADTPAPGQIITVNAGGDFQGALNSAGCGDTIQLQAGAVFAGDFTLPAKGCDDAHWIIIRTSAPDSSLPPEGTRLTPCYSGVPSLPGRPPFNCLNTNVVTAQILGTGSDGPLTFLQGATHYRFIGLEITRAPASSSLPIVYQIAEASVGAAADHIIFDRIWAHGTAQDETNHGIRLNGITWAAVIDSFFTDFHCVSVTGGCTDAQAISGGNGDLPGGPFKIVDNFIEAAGEGILFGGADGSIVASDIEVRRNHFFKPLTWLQGQPGYVGGVDGNPFVVKNHFELKDAQRVLFEANVLENTWGGFSQSGWAILLTPRGSWAPVQDVTIRYCTISHAGAGMTLSGTLDEDHGNVDSLAAQRWSIHDVTIDDIDASKYDGTGNLFQIANWLASRSLNHITINHVTGITDPNHGVFTTGEDLTSPISASILMTNNIFLAGLYSIWPTGFDNPCSSSLDPLTLISACWNPYTFAGNAFILPSSQSDALWPAGNFFPADVSAVQFTNYNNGNGGDYTLLPGSPYKNAGTDGTDLGADIETINSEINGVY